ncbi:hypothetical protein TanjilG_12614 [Lupinus angustifolius]|uniref:PWWP domain-containing protein n=1 Tax=Lupinus angustifolius TaxID=3871 RepID=A0A4P1QYR7_LUPAN|nr:hypothetical protein TanjilG_12614 [Lupinus angustifolius]
MKTRGSPSKGESVKSNVSEGGEKQVTPDSVALGDMIWIRLRHGSWWPAQVVDAKSVNKSMKPKKRSAGDILVRLYGSYKYSYVDPIRCKSEFETDLPSKKSSRSKGSSSESKGTPSKRKSHPKDGDDLDSESPETTALVKSQELSTRRVRVMASLGLIAPTGSPFHKDGHNSNQN